MVPPDEVIYPRILRAGDRAVTIEFSDQISERANLQVQALNDVLVAGTIAGVVETIPTYRSLTVIHDPRRVRGAALGRELLQLATTTEMPRLPGRLFEFPVLYGGEHTADLQELAAMKDLSVAEVIRLHGQAEYRVYMIGFAPGFAYLGGLPEILHTPRLAVPRQRIEAGAIGIGGRQSSINSLPGPSGWRFLGRTPYRLFDPARQDPFLLRAGDRIRFRAIDADEAAELEAQAADGTLAIKEVH